MHPWGRALLGLALACAAAVGLLALGSRAPLPIAFAIVLALMAHREPDFRRIAVVRIAPKTSPPRA